ncbi:hypothetical protein RCL_jg24963.t1 [Rhizophagus clarus]|uniref:Uncharacterized protein n=1 Tax=Rhizophagus clarus TaxID=94130 RepID=A0A8H3LTE8_9GLOM|nr:hypothetical protein RCL_jg24963.t1 [Rhizophagus clarus]
MPYVDDEIGTTYGTATKQNMIRNEAIDNIIQDDTQMSDIEIHTFKNTIIEISSSDNILKEWMRGIITLATIKRLQKQNMMTKGIKLISRILNLQQNVIWKQKTKGEGIN